MINEAELLRQSVQNELNGKNKKLKELSHLKVWIKKKVDAAAKEHQLVTECYHDTVEKQMNPEI